MGYFRFKTVLDKLNDDDMFCLGSKTGFFFIGTKAEFERDLESVKDWCKNNTQDEAKGARESWEKTIKAGLPKRDVYGDNYDRWAKDAFVAITRLGNAQKRLMESEQAWKDYKPVMDRVVYEKYERDVPDDPAKLVIILTGSENGRYWLRSEYEAKEVSA